MRRIDTPDGYYHDENPLTGTAGTVVKAAPLNSLQEEVVSVITAAGYELDAENNKQLLEAIQAITGGSRILWGAIEGKPNISLEGHEHDAADITTGVFDLARIPDLPISKVSALSATLDTKAPKASPQFSGIVTIGNHAGIAPLDVETGKGRIMFRYAGEMSTISSVNSQNNAFAALNIDAASLTLSGLPIWYSGNFNPASKADLSGASFTGHVTMPSLNASSSDRRLKYEIEDLRDCLSVVRRLRPRSYRLKSDGSRDFGWVAQEHKRVLPNATHTIPNGPDGLRNQMFVKYGKAEPYLAGAIAELADIVEALQKRVAELEGDR